MYVQLIVQTQLAYIDPLPLEKLVYLASIIITHLGYYSNHNIDKHKHIPKISFLSCDKYTHTVYIVYTPAKGLPTSQGLP